ncbi:MAG TPA: hypothetical protein VGC89_21390 [Pyrinomonadaceae bacterium]|jgi:hypothetical protein
MNTQIMFVREERVQRLTCSWLEQVQADNRDLRANNLYAARAQKTAARKIPANTAARSRADSRAAA